MKKIFLWEGRGKSQKQMSLFVTVDDIDFDALNQYQWFLMKIYHTNKKIYYARRYELGKAILMHRIILFADKRNQHGDHIDGNGLNNCRENLRISNHSQNQFNSSSIRGKSIYKGVRFPDFKNRKPSFSAEIGVNGKKIRIGSFKTEAEAALAYNKKAVFYAGEFAKLNILQVV